MRFYKKNIPGDVTGDFFFRGNPRQNHVPWGRLSLWKWVPGISAGVKLAGAFGWRPLPPLECRNVKKFGALTCPETIGPPRPVAGDLYYKWSSFEIANMIKLLKNDVYYNYFRLLQMTAV